MHEKNKNVERNELNRSIQSATNKIATLTQTKYDLKKEQLQIQSEVGIQSNISQNSYTVTQLNLSLKMIRWVIIIIVFVFDPLAVLLLISANITLKEERKRRRTKVTRTRRRKQKQEETAWERKLKERKPRWNDQGCTRKQRYEGRIL